MSKFKIYGLPKDTLNPKFWDNDNKINSKVRNQLLLIAEKFFELLEDCKITVLIGK
jgi:hypothetical protein